MSSTLKPKYIGDIADDIFSCLFLDVASSILMETSLTVKLLI